ncbi:DUF3606 domain-containing protein [Bradyrhizobium japonicum]|uniref:DUF3606 domain-containing protein n=1 Tax=Bradyrhizobium japonicum TaxID=375 RepID=UPI001BA45DD4|nr:DUF3606 domain-containing protein [Bradyrhizobium japonicum]MBR0993959.1 DUF3606 domain-containing protein [Bradyrhizobium japonicum]
MNDNLTKRDQRDRSKIKMHEDFEVKYWTKCLGVSKDELQKAVDKVGNSAAAVRKSWRREPTRAVCLRSLEQGPRAF